MQVGDAFVDLAGWAVDLVQSFGYIGIFILIALDAVVPSELILPLAGFLIGQGHLSFGGVLVAATGGSLTSALGLYGMGRWLGDQRLRRLTRRLDRLPLVKEQVVDRAQAWFLRHGGKAVCLCRVVPSARTVISIPAGLAQMPLGKFVVYTALGSSLWNGTLIGLGWGLGAHWQQARQYAQQYAQLVGYAAIILLGIVAAWWVVRRRRA